MNYLSKNDSIDSSTISDRPLNECGYKHFPVAVFTPTILAKLAWPRIDALICMVAEANAISISLAIKSGYHTIPRKTNGHCATEY